MQNSTVYTNAAKFAEELGCTVLRDEPMSRRTTFRTGGSASLFTEVQSEAALSEFVKYLNREKINYIIIGKGSNMLVSDNGVSAVVISLSGDFKSLCVENNTITAGAGAPLSSVCTSALENGLTGFEFAYGIPGSVGGAVFMNAGAYGSEVKQVIKSCRYMDRAGEIYTMEKQEMELSYRHSIFKSRPYIILSASFELEYGDAEEIRRQMDTHMQARKDKQPLEYPNAGSTFKRPEGSYAGMLIEQCGLKGKTVGGAMVSEKHAGFIINYSGATSNDIKELMSLVSQTVLEKTGYSLEPEIIYID